MECSLNEINKALISLFKCILRHRPIFLMVITLSVSLPPYISLSSIPCSIRSSSDVTTRALSNEIFHISHHLKSQAHEIVKVITNSTIFKSSINKYINDWAIFSLQHSQINLLLHYDPRDQDSHLFLHILVRVRSVFSSQFLQ